MRRWICSRPLELLPEEREFLQAFFGPALDLRRLRLRVGGPASWGSTRVVGSTVFFDRRSGFPEQRGTPRGRSLLVHEAVHVWQFQKQGWRYACGAVAEQARAWLRTGSRRGAYHYSLSPDRPLPTYGYEQQAQMIQDYFDLACLGDDRGMRTHCRDLDRLGRPAAADRLYQRYTELRWDAPPPSPV